MLEVRFLEAAKDVFHELPPKDQEAILESLHLAPSFPEMHSICRIRPFRSHRQFVVLDRWLVLYRVVADVIWVRIIYPARAKPL